MSSQIPSNASSHPRRSKSFSSIRPQQLRHAKSFNTSQVTHYEALTAAELAFQRARERNADENDCQSSSTVPVTHPAFPFESPHLAKRQSVRFTGSNAVKTRELPHTRRVASNNQDFQDERETDWRPEYVETGISSEPSSYRKLRKAKSMFSPGKPPSIVSGVDTHTSRTHFKHDSMRSSGSHNDPPSLPDRRLRHSLSFLRGVTDRLSTADRHHAANDAAIAMARDQYLRQLEAQRIKEQPGPLNLMGRRKSPKDFRRPIRNSSANSYSAATMFSSWSVEPAKVKSIGRKARSVSQTLKLALKKVFRRPMPNDLHVPEQHLSATKAHYGEWFDGDYDERYFSPIPSPDVEILRRVDSRESIIRNSTAYNEVMISNESILSAATEEESSNQQSRVTSWTDSTKANTIHLPQFVERKRLSIIREDGGPHHCSSSAGLSMDSMNGYAAFRQPARLDTASPVVAQRVYSALQKEIQKSESAIIRDESDLRNGDGPEQLESIPSACDALRRPSDEHIVMDVRPAAEPQTRGIAMWESFLLDAKPTSNGDDTPFRPVENSFEPRVYDGEYVEAMERLTPQQIAHLNEPEIPTPKKPLRKVKSTLLTSDLQVKKRTLSPNRQPYLENIGPISNVDGKERRKEIDSWARLSLSPLPVRHGRAETSESVYSRTEGGHTPRALGSSISLSKSESSAEMGAAVIITGGLRSSQHSFPASSQRPHISDDSSGEWKKHMASERYFFDNQNSEHDGIYYALPVKESGHKRENAEWDTERVTIGAHYKPAASSAHPFERSQAGNNGRPALQERMMSRSNIGRSAHQDSKTTGREENSAQKENSPDRRSKNLSDKQAKVDTVDSFVAPTITTFDGSHSAASYLNQSPQSENQNSPGTVNSRRSPERTERLRRLRNRSSQSLQNPSTSPKFSSNTEYEITQGPPTSSPYTPTRFEPPFSRLDHQDTSRNALVGAFLKSRRSQLRISDDSANDAAFL